MKIGFYGGAFDPFHIEHKNSLLQVYKELNLDKIVVYPSFLPPHKSCIGNFDDRLATVEVGTSDMPFVIIDDIEKVRDKVNPTCEVLPLLKDKYPADDHYLIIGGDSMLNFYRWIRPDLIAKECKIAVIRREGIDLKDNVINAKNSFNADITVVNYVGKNVSSSITKAEIMLGNQPLAIEEKVYNLIRERKMYGDFEAIVNKLKTTIPEKTFLHSCRTVKYALKLNVAIGLDYKKVFLSALLHDCAKHLHQDIPSVPQAVEHQYIGATVAKHEYGIVDSEILDAIRYHSTGKPNMTTLGKLIYCADMLEEGRNYPGVEDLRAIIEKDFNVGFLTCVKSSLNRLLIDCKEIDPLTKQCHTYYNNEK